MKICFNEATTLKNSNLERDLELCEKYGYDLIEIRNDKLKEYLKDHSLSDLAKFFQTHNIKPYAFNAIEFINFRTYEDYGKIKEELEFLCKVGEEINCFKTVVVPSFDIGEYTRRQIQEETVKVLRELGEIAERYNMVLAFEFVGYPNCSVNTLGQAYSIVEEVRRENVGLVIDCFHFHAMNSRLEDLRKVDPKKIFILHIDDCEDLPPGQLRDKHRLLPGEGAIDLDSILLTLKGIGYDEMVSVELFRPEYWDWEAEELIKVAKEKTESIVRKYF